MSHELSELDITNLRALLTKGAINPKEITDALLARIDSVDSEINAWEYIDTATIDKQLSKITKYSKKSSLYGVPIGIKDIYNTFDMPTQMGSPLWKNFTPGNDARTVHYLRRNGAIILGKTVTAEFAVHYQDKTKNPHDLTRSPGTSSGGSAAAVAAQMVPAAFGSQTAGSISRPASYCGIYGYKPTFGLLPRIGVLKTTDSLDTLGFFTRSARDLRLLLDASRVSGKNYEYAYRYLDQHASSANSSFSVGVVRHPKWNLIENSLKERFDSFIVELSRHKEIEISDCKLPNSIEDIYGLHATIYDKALAYYFKEAYEARTLVSPIFYDIIQTGNEITKEEYHSAIEQQAQMTQDFNEYFAKHDILVTLTAANEAPIGLTTPDTLDSNLIWTFLGMPTISIPLFTGENGLPVGLLVASKKYSDYRLLEFAQWLAKHFLEA